MNATSEQVELMRMMGRKDWLKRDDFRDSGEFYRKKTMSTERADELIKIGNERRKRQEMYSIAWRMRRASRRGYL